MALAVRRWPRAQNLADARQHVFKVRCSLLKKLPNVGAGGRPRAPQCDDLFNLGEREPEAAALTYEGQDAEHVFGIDAIAGRAASWRGQDASRLVETKRFPTEPAPLCHFPDQEPSCAHALTLNRVPWGKVKVDQRSGCA
jgi:hypothetical protein